VLLLFFRFITLPGYPKIDQLDAAFFGQEYVSGFDIPMCDVLRWVVQVCYGGDDLEGD